MRSVDVFVGILLSIISAVHSWSATSYQNSSSTVSLPATTKPPIYCGTCAFYYEVHAHVWWSSILTDFVATMIYTVEKGSGLTIGSSLKVPMNATVIPGKQNVTAYAGGGPVEYTTLNTLKDGDLATIVQTNLITLNGTKNGYGVSTLHVNTSLTGTARTTCKYSYYAPNPTNTSKLPGLPAMTGYSYTTVIPYDATYNMSNANAYGLDILASEVATFLHLTVPNCTYYGGGTGTLKVGVTALMDISTVYAPAQVQGTTTSTSPAPPVQTTTPTPSPSSTPPATTPTTTTVIPQSGQEKTVASSGFSGSETTGGGTSTGVQTSVLEGTTANSVSNVYVTTIIYTTSGPSGFETITTESTIGAVLPTTTPSSSALEASSAHGLGSYTTIIIYTTSGAFGLETISSVATLPSGSYTTTITYTTSGVSGLETISTVATLPPGSYVTEIVETTSGPSGLETTSEASTLNLASYILSVAGFTQAPPTSTPTSTISSSSSGSLPASFTGDASRIGRGIWLGIVGMSLAIMFMA
ncbi:hypothetical protein BDZ45DRAFT_726148 [Acephala macrosclerotiorum]|nr:hypothetical protein BDZ45DRAFT_726148 [Acephala macrosclerotiorum]